MIGGQEESQHGGRREEEEMQAMKWFITEEGKTHKLTEELGFPWRVVLPTRL